MQPELNRRAQSADIGLLLEGTFPYVAGGVSSWVDKLIRTFPQYTFAVVFIGSRREDYPSPVYELPDNVVHFEAHFIQATPVVEASMHPRVARPEVFERVERLHDALRNDTTPGMLAHCMHGLMPALGRGGGLGEREFLHSEESWNLICARYEERCTDPSFTDYFWTIRTMHKPLWQLVSIAEGLINVKVYHTISTGYAGFLGALLHFKRGVPLLVTEHGIYTKERQIDLLQSQWIHDNRSAIDKDITQVGYLHNLWVRFFAGLGRICYEAASEIVSLFEGNRLRQIADGAAPEKTRVIPNGISIARYASLRTARPPAAPLVVAFIGRVVPIKDVKTFIRGMFIASRKMPALKGWVIGPQEEDPRYAQECKALVTSLGMERNLQFLGMQRIDEFLPQVGLVALSSVSEGQPLVVLEAFAAGVPVVTTDVGSCRELIEGRNTDDRELGAAGAVVPIANPDLFASAVLNLLGNSQAWRAAQNAAIARVERYYADSLMEDSYGALYQAQIQASQPAAARYQWPA